MSDVTETIKAHHREIAKRMADTSERATRSGAPADLDDLLAFLREDLLPHARGEEGHLYVTVDSLVPMPGRATATMRIDHEHIETYVRMIGVAADRILSAQDDAARAAGRGALRDLVLRLQAVVDVHLEKEERDYLPLIERFLTPQAQERLLAEIHETADAAAKGEPIIDVRRIAHHDRHRRIFETFDALPEGSGFILVNDHDPKPLYRQFATELPGRFTWEYLEQGPEWRIRIGRPASTLAEVS